MVFRLVVITINATKKAKKGMLYFGDKETPKAFSISFDQNRTRLPIIGGLAIILLSWRLGVSAPMVDIKLTKLSDKSIDTLTNAVTTHIQSDNLNGGN